MRSKFSVSAALFFAVALTPQVRASTFSFKFAGPNVSGDITLTYGTATDATYHQAFEVTGITGTFTDTNNGLNLINVPINGLVPVNRAIPEPGNTLAPNDFSRYAVASGLSPVNNGFLTYDNLYYPNGSPQTASDYPVSGGYFDIYGLMFNIGGGKIVDFWSNGDFSGTGTGHVDYGVAVADPDMAFDYVGGGVSITPEPAACALMASGLAAILVWRRRAATRRAVNS